MWRLQSNATLSRNGCLLSVEIGRRSRGWRRCRRNLGLLVTLELLGVRPQAIMLEAFQVRSCYYVFSSTSAGISQKPYSTPSCCHMQCVPMQDHSACVIIITTNYITIQCSHNTHSAKCHHACSRPCCLCPANSPSCLTEISHISDTRLKYKTQLRSETHWFTVVCI